MIGFVVSAPSCRVHVELSASRCRVRFQRRRMLKCQLKSNEEASDVSESSSKERMGNTLSAQERMAAVLGKDIQQARAEFEQRNQKNIETRAKDLFEGRIAAIIGFSVGVMIHIFLRTNPLSPITVLGELEKMSPPLEVALTNGKPTLVEFYAPWCVDCGLMADKMSQLHAEYSSSINFVLLNGDKPDNQEAVSRFRVEGIPHIAFVEPGGSVATTFVGMIPKEILHDDLDALMRKKPLPYYGINVFSDDLYDESSSDLPSDT
mmetsp:Transcript_10461/g.18859  ORF Transcript_10461/g.18859 Transcript_10461/m.18859 type:complete len:263 (-) Transcript_10461:17-805(-)